MCGLNPEDSAVAVVVVAGVDRRRVVRLPRGRRRFEVRELTASVEPVARLSRNVCDKLNRRNLRVLKKREEKNDEISDIFVLDISLSPNFNNFDDDDSLSMFLSFLSVDQQQQQNPFLFNNMSSKVMFQK